MVEYLCIQIDGETEPLIIAGGGGGAAFNSRWDNDDFRKYMGAEGQDFIVLRILRVEGNIMEREETERKEKMADYSETLYPVEQVSF